MMNVDMSAVSFAQTLLKPILECEGVKCYDGGQIWCSECSKSLTNEGGGAAVMSVKLNFDLFDMCHYHDCVHVLHTSAAVPCLQWQRTTRLAWTQMPTFHLSTDLWIRPTQTFMPRIDFCFKSCRDITLSEFALDLSAYTCFHTKASIFHIELLTCE